jgi:VanZ family protein
MNMTHRQKITIVVLVIYWAVLAVVAHIPIPQIVYQARVSDKWLHALSYLNLVFLLWFAVRPDSKVSWRSRVVWLIFFVAVVYGGADELLQPCAGRTKDLGDFLANVAGALVGLVVFTYLSFWPALLATSGVTIFGLTNLAKADLSKLVPVLNAAFHIVAYGCFTLVWIRFMNLYLLRVAVSRWLLAISVPLFFLLIVKTASLLLGRHFALSDLFLASLGIVVVAIARELWVFRRHVSSRYPVNSSR